MKLIIAGSRHILVSNEEIKALLNHYGLNPSEIVSGTARGVDQCGETYAHTNGIAVAEFPADWNKHGKAAGPIRNQQMAHYADALLIIWDGKSSGSGHMKSYMTKLGKPVYEAVLK